MPSLGMLMLGAFIGFVVIYGLNKVTDWSKPESVFSAVISAAVAGAVFVFIQYLGKLGDALFFYPIGLAYGAVCFNLRWMTEPNAKGMLVFWHSVAFAAASVLLLALLLSPAFRGLLPVSS